MNIREIINTVNGCEFATIDAVTEVKLTGGKSNPFQGRVTKRTVGSNVMIFSNSKSSGYDNMVKRRLEAEGKDPASFQLSPRSWGVRETGTPFVVHNGSDYLEVIFLRAGTSTYLVDGQPYDGVIPGLPAKREAEQGGLSNKVIIRTYHVASITALTLRGNRFILDNGEVVALAR